uniref:Uncharacterized protein n=1 Tax=Arundo donax TaxID=35708 RepID=A0A0A9E062_ARUDO
MYGHLGRDGVLGVLLHRLEGEVPDEQPDHVVLRERVLALWVVGGELRDGPGHHGLHLHGALLEHLGEGQAGPGLHHLLDTLRVAAKEADGERGVLLAFEAALLYQLEQRRHTVLLYDELGVPVIVARERDEAGGGVGAGVEVAGVEHGDLLPDEEEDGLVLRDGGQADVGVEVVVVGGRRRDAEEPGEVADGVVELVGHLLEGAGGDDGEDAADEAVRAALVDEGERLVERLLGVVEDAAGRALVEVGARGLAEQAGEALDLGLELHALLPERVGLVGPFDDLLRELDRPRQDLLEVVHLGSRRSHPLAAPARSTSRMAASPKP